MKHLIISFKSRNELYSFSRVLKLNNIYNLIINTPSSIGSSCTLSLQVEFIHYKSTYNLIQRLKPKTFLGLYSISKNLNGNNIVKML